MKKNFLSAVNLVIVVGATIFLALGIGWIIFECVMFEYNLSDWFWDNGNGFIVGTFFVVAIAFIVFSVFFCKYWSLKNMYEAEYENYRNTNDYAAEMQEKLILAEGNLSETRQQKDSIEQTYKDLQERSEKSDNDQRVFINNLSIWLTNIHQNLFEREMSSSEINRLKENVSRLLESVNALNDKYQNPLKSFSVVLDESPEANEIFENEDCYGKFDSGDASFNNDNN
ncbi:MAG: hypothetical protein LBU68_01620 [Rickettsiales bacterium]|jgi:hypothetical protein|nr:hypothetical protein [Rickettsiales bacterium]